MTIAVCIRFVLMDSDIALCFRFSVCRDAFHFSCFVLLVLKVGGFVRLIKSCLKIEILLCSWRSIESKYFRNNDR